jgi:hypothetical protein
LAGGYGDVADPVPSEALWVLDGTAILYRAFYSKTQLEGYGEEERPLILMGTFGDVLRP